MYEALELAGEAARRGEVPVGAVAVMDDQVIGRGFNQPISAQDPTAHAEIEALRDAARSTGNYRLPGADLYVTVEPCTMCAGALVHARIRRLVFGAREPRAGAVVSSIRALDNESLNHQVEVIEGVLAEDCSRMMSGFFQQKRG